MTRETDALYNTSNTDDLLKEILEELRKLNSNTPIDRWPDRVQYFPSYQDPHTLPLVSPLPVPTFWDNLPRFPERGFSHPGVPCQGGNT